MKKTVPSGKLARLRSIFSGHKLNWSTSWWFCQLQLFIYMLETIFILLAEQLSLILFSLMTKVPQIPHLPLAGQDLHILPTSLNSIITTELPIHPHPPDVFYPLSPFLLLKKTILRFYKSPWNPSQSTAHPSTSSWSVNQHYLLPAHLNPESLLAAHLNSILRDNPALLRRNLTPQPCNIVPQFPSWRKIFCSTFYDSRWIFVASHPIASPNIGQEEKCITIVSERR